LTNAPEKLIPIFAPSFYNYQKEVFMHLLRIQIPDFRVLKDVDITFEKEFSPRIFPLGSQNGGGKSTLLQLIFVLLHCPGAPERLPFLRNMLRGFKPSENESKKVLATIDIWDGEEEVRMEFFSCRDSYLNDEDDGAIETVSNCSSYIL